VAGLADTSLNQVDKGRHVAGCGGGWRVWWDVGVGRGEGTGDCAPVISVDPWIHC
jgi:hypothetical protein